MIGTSRISMFVVVLTAGLLIFTPFATAQQCTQRGVITADADVYTNPPRYVTGTAERNAADVPGFMILPFTNTTKMEGLYGKGLGVE